MKVTLLIVISNQVPEDSENLGVRPTHNFPCSIYEYFIQKSSVHEKLENISRMHFRFITLMMNDYNPLLKWFKFLVFSIRKNVILKQYYLKVNLTSPSYNLVSGTMQLACCYSNTFLKILKRNVYHFISHYITLSTFWNCPETTDAISIKLLDISRNCILKGFKTFYLKMLRQHFWTGKFEN